MQLVGLTEKFIEKSNSLNEYEIQLDALTKRAYNESLEIFFEDSGYKSLTKRDPSLNYNGENIPFLKDKNNWHPWQTYLGQLLFTKSGSIKPANGRSLIAVYNKSGNVGKLTYASSSQMRSAVIENGLKKKYLIDLPRTQEKQDNEYEILSILEDVKNGKMISNMYGKSRKLLTHPNHLIVFSNYLLDPERLTQDWLE